MSGIISMEKYSEMYYEFSSKITQGVIIPYNKVLQLPNMNQKALLIIENACNLEEQEDSKPKVEMVEYINLFDPFLFVVENNRILGNFFLKIIQNRDFESKLVYLPNHNSMKQCKICNLITISKESSNCSHCGKEVEEIRNGLIGVCNKSGYIPLVLLERFESNHYLCVKTPYRDYIKNKYAQFKLHLPIHTITDIEAKAWIIKQAIQDKKTNSLEEITKRLKLSKIEDLIKKMVENGFLNFDENSKEYQLANKV